MHSWHIQTAPAFAVQDYEGIQISRNNFLSHAGMATGVLYWPFYRIHASYTQKLKIPVRKKTTDFVWKIFEKENPAANVLFRSFKFSSCFFSLLNFCFLVLSFPNATSTIFVSIWHAGGLFIRKASPNIMQLLWLLTYLNSITWSGLHSFIWMDFRDTDLNDPPVAICSVFAFFALLY